MTHDSETVWCAGCGVEILWAPVRAGGRDYCCDDCREGCACQCGERAEQDERRAAAAPGTSSALPAYGPLM